MAESLGAMGSPGAPGSPVRSDAQHVRSYVWPGLALLAVLAGTVAQLRFQGRRWWCACGRPDLWWGDVRSAHTSQHLFDPYSFTHILHGLVFYGLLSRVAPRLSLAWRFCAAVTLAATWEVIENSDFVIHRYRTATASWGYQGDSIANSLGDILSCALGFLLARRLGLWGSLALFAVTEVALLLWIRDSLVLEVLMLLWPINAIKEWQMGR
jgi:hypothetical protein